MVESSKRSYCLAATVTNHRGRTRKQTSLQLGRADIADTRAVIVQTDDMAVEQYAVRNGHAYDIEE